MKSNTSSNPNSPVESVSAVQVAQTIESDPDRWIQQIDQVIATSRVESVTADEVRSAFENLQFPDGTLLSNTPEMFRDQRLKEAFIDYLNNPTAREVRALADIDPWFTIYRDYGHPEKMPSYIESYGNPRL